MTATPGRRSVVRGLPRVLLVSMAALLLLAAVAVLALPAAIRLAIPYLLEREAGLASSVERVTAHVWDGRFVLHGLRIGARDGYALFLERVLADVDMGALLRGHPRVLRLELGAGEIDIEAARHTRWRRADAGDDAAHTARDPGPVVLPDVDLHDVRLRWLSARLGRPAVLRRLTLERPDPGIVDRAQLSLEMGVGDGGVVLDGVLNADRAGPGFVGEVTVRGLDVSGVAVLFPGAGVSQLDGILDLAGTLNVVVNPRQGEARGGFDGRIAVAKGAYAGPAVADLQAALEYQGTIELAWPFLGAPAGRLAGTLTVPRLRLDAADDDAPVTRLSLSGMRFAGEAGVDAAGVASLRGELTAAGVDVETASGDSMRVRAEGVMAGLESLPPSAAGAQRTGLVVKSAQLDGVSVSPAGDAFAALRGRSMTVAGLSVALGAGVEVTRVEAAELAAEDGAAPAWRAGDLSVNALSVDATGAVTSGVATAGGVTVGLDAAAVRLGAVRVERFSHAADGAIRLSRVTLSSLEAPLSGAPLEASDIALDGLAVAADGTAFAADAVRAASAAHDPPDGVPWTVAGMEAATVSIAADRAASVAGINAASVTINAPDATIGLTAARLTGLTVAPSGALAVKQVAAGELKASLAGGLQLASLAAEADGLAWQAGQGLSAGAIRADAMEVRREEATARVESPRIEGLRVLAAGGAPHAAARVSFKGARAWQEGRAESRIGPLQATDLRVGGDGEVGVVGLLIQGLRLGPEATPSFVASDLRMEGLQLTPTLTRIKGLAAADPVVRLERSADGFEVPALPFQNVPASTQGGVGRRLRLVRFATSGPGRLDFIDRQTDPAFEVTVSPLSVEIADLDTTPGSEPGTFKLDGRVGEFSRLGAQGSIAATRDGLNVAFSSRLTGLDLVLLTPYLSTLQGSEVRSGRADLKLDGSLTEDRVDARSEVVISKLELSPDAARDDAATAAPRGGLPLSTALMLLRDDEGTVRLKVPITGALSDPEFDFSDAVGQAVAKAATGAVMAAFQPVGLLLSAASAVTGLSAVGFKPVVFGAADAELPAEGLTRLDALAKTLEDRRSLKLMVCGRATAADAGALPPAANDTVEATLAALARARAARVRDYLTQRHRVREAQLMDCPPAVDVDAGAEPRVELVLDAAAPDGGPRGTAADSRRVEDRR